MHELEGRIGGAGPGELLAHVVFDRLDVVVDARLDRLDGFRRGWLGRGCELACALAHRGAEVGSRQLRHGRRHVQQPLRLDADALENKCALGEQATERCGRCLIAPIHRRERIER